MHKNYFPSRILPFVTGAMTWMILGWLTAASPAVAAQKLPTPFQEHFQGTNLDQSWTQWVSQGGKMELKNGGVNFDAPMHAQAHMQKRCGVDLITYTGRIAQWGSIYLVWDANNWCGVGQLSPTPFGRLYSTTVIKGKGEETDHRGIDFGLARLVRIQLGGNYVRFLYSNDGKEWIELRTVERPKAFSGAPQLIAAGKYYDAADQPFAAPVAKASTEDGRAGGRISSLRVEATAASERNLSRSELKKLRAPKIEPVSAVLSESKEDPTFDKISPFYPAMKSPREVVGIPAHPLDIGVDWLARLDVSPWTALTAWFEVGAPLAPLGRADVPITRRLLHGYLPIDTLTTTHAGIDYELTVFGWSENFSVDKPLFAYVRIVARSTNGITTPQQFALASPAKVCHTWTVNPGADKSAQLFLKFKFPEPDSAAEITPAEFEKTGNEIAQLWEQKLAPATRFDLPDVRIMEAYRAWLTYSLLNADTINGYVEPHDGAGFYEEMFGCSVSVHSRALDYYGLTDYATSILDTQLHFQQADGLYTQACGLTDPGSLLVALAKHFEMTGNREWLRRVVPNAIKQCQWLTHQREIAPKTGPMRGLIKFRPYNDYPHPVYNYLGNAWCASGMELIAKALKQIEIPEADAISAEAASYRKDILDSMDANAFSDNGQTILPLEPDTHRLLKLSRNRCGDYYGLTASSLLETEFLAPDDNRTSWIVDGLEKRGGLLAGVTEFEGGIDHAYTYGYLMTELRRNEVRKTLLGFWSMLAFGMTRDTYSPVEVTMIAPGENHYTLPHLYSCTEQLRLLRNLLLREDKDVLWIGEGIPQAWLAPGKHVAVMAAPTEFGDVSYRIDARSNGTMHIRIDPPSRRTPAEIRLRLREPGHRQIASARIVPGGVVECSADTIILRNQRTPADLEVEFQK